MFSHLLRNQTVRSERPKNLNLLTIRFPITAIASILHRISGFILFLLIPGLLWLLQSSLDGARYDDLREWLSGDFIKLIVWLLMAPFCYHLVAGIRHLLSDLHIGNTKTGGRLAAKLTFVFSIILFILAGIWLW